MLSLQDRACYKRFCEDYKDYQEKVLKKELNQEQQKKKRIELKQLVVLTGQCDLKNQDILEGAGSLEEALKKIYEHFTKMILDNDQEQARRHVQGKYVNLPRYYNFYKSGAMGHSKPPSPVPSESKDGEPSRPPEEYKRGSPPSPTKFKL